MSPHHHRCHPDVACCHGHHSHVNRRHYCHPDSRTGEQDISQQAWADVPRHMPLPLKEADWCIPQKQVYDQFLSPQGLC